HAALTGRAHPGRVSDRPPGIIVRALHGTRAVDRRGQRRPGAGSYRWCQLEAPTRRANSSAPRLRRGASERGGLGGPSRPPFESVPEVGARVDRLPLDQNLVVQVRAGRAAGVAGPADDGATLDTVAGLDVSPREVTIDALDVLAVVEHDGDPVFLVGSGDRHDATGRSADRRAVLGADVQAAVELVPRRPRRLAHAELGVDGPPDRPPRRQRGEPFPRLPEEPVERLEAVALLGHRLGQTLELVARRELASHAVDAEGATTDRAIAAAGLELGAERLPDPRVKI